MKGGSLAGVGVHGDLETPAVAFYHCGIGAWLPARQITERRDQEAALRFLKKAIRRNGLPETITSDGSEEGLTPPKASPYQNLRHIRARFCGEEVTAMSSPYPTSYEFGLPV